MSETGTCPLNQQQVIDQYFLEHRAKLIDIAAYLDRIDRAEASGLEDVRDEAFREALKILSDGQPHRAKRVLLLLSDHTTEMVQSAHGMKGAMGAPPTLSPEGGTE